MNDEKSLFLVKVDEVISVTTHDFGYASKKQLELLKLPTNKKKTVRLLEYGLLKTTSSQQNYIKKATRA